MVIRAVTLAALLCAPPLGAAAQDLHYLGFFHNVSSGDGGDHCAGYSLRLWRYRERAVEGTFNGKPARLERERESPNVVLEPNRSLAAVRVLGLGSQMRRGAGGV